MKCFLKMLSFFMIVLIVFVSCDGGSIKPNINDDTGVSDDDSENITDSDDIGDTGDTGDSGNTGDTGNTVSETCGDKIVDNGEICDGSVINCVDVDAKLYSGGKANCLETCLGWDTITCDEIPHTCGNDVTEGPEECDKNTINCIDLDSDKYESGKAKCLTDCSGYDAMTCIEYTPSVCGDDKVEGKEVCDGNIANCVDIDSDKYSGGKAYCNDDCTGWDDVTCDEKPVCNAKYKVVKCTRNTSLDQIQTCSDGVWADKGNCLEPGKYAILERGAAKTDMNIDFEATPDGTDIVLIFDTSGSMSAAIEVLKTNIATITENIRTEIPDSYFALVTLGTLGYSPFVPVKNVTADMAAFETAVTGLGCGNGSYEYHTLTIEQSASGSGTSQSIKPYEGSSIYNTVISASSCAAGLRGGVCFRENSLPVFILMSDEVFDTSGWIWTAGTETTIDDATDSINAINGKIAVIDSSGETKALIDNSLSLANSTDSLNSLGDPYYYSTPYAATDLNLKIEEAVKAIYDETEMTAGLDFESASGNSINAEQFVESHKTVSANPTEGISSKDNDYFYGTLRETILKYSVSLSNSSSSPAEMTFLTLNMNLNWNNITLDTVPFTIVIP